MGHSQIGSFVDYLLVGALLFLSIFFRIWRLVVSLVVILIAVALKQITVPQISGLM